jgi:hypothetical protein
LDAPASKLPADVAEAVKLIVERSSGPQSLKQDWQGMLSEPLHQRPFAKPTSRPLKGLETSKPEISRAEGYGGLRLYI